MIHDEIADHPGGASITNGYEHGSLTDGLVAYYPLDDPDTTDAIDQTQLRNNGTINGAVYNGSGQVGSDSLSFDGTDDTVSTSSEVSISTHTVSVWVKTTDTEDFAGFFVTGDVGYVQQVLNGSNGTFRVGIDSDTNASGDRKRYYGSTQINDGNWHNLVHTYDSVSDTLELFVDGSKESVTKEDDNAVSFDETSVVKLGVDNGGGNYINSLIDDVRIFDRALSQPEIEALSNRTETSPIVPDHTIQ